MATQILSKIGPTVEEKITERLNAKSGCMCDTLLDEFINSEVTVTDHWGETKVSQTSIRNVLKRRFNEFWCEEVDRQGNDRFHSYGERKPRYLWIVEKVISNCSKDFIRELTTKLKTFQSDDQS